MKNLLFLIIGAISIFSASAQCVPSYGMVGGLAVASPFVSSGFFVPQGMTMDGTGNVFITDWNNTVTKITPAGVVSTYATGLNRPGNLTIDGDGNLYVINNGSIYDTIVTFDTAYVGPSMVITSDTTINAQNDNTISKITSSGDTGTVSVFVSGLNSPFGITTDGTYLYVTNQGDNTISKIEIATSNTSTLATINGGMFDMPSVITITNDGTLYTLVNLLDNTISKISSTTGAVTNYVSQLPQDGTVGGITTDGTNLYATLGDSISVYKITPDGAVSAFAVGASIPFAIATDGNGLFYVSDGNDSVKKFTVPRVSACGSYTSNGHTHTASGTYNDTLVGAAASGCDSIVTLYLSLTNGVTGSLTHTACDSYVFAGRTLTASGTYSDTLVGTAASGCDSIVMLHLTINHGTAGTATIAACQSYTWINGQNYTASNTTDTVHRTNAVGCDSIVTLHLTINHSDTGIVAATSCNSYTFFGSAKTASGTYWHTITGGNSHGCDSIVRLNLTINQSTAGTEVQAACESYTWINGQTYMTSNSTDTVHRTNAAGCDSIVTLHLTINHNSTSTQNITVCDSFSFGGQMLAASGIYVDTLTSVGGCDSIVTLNLTVNPYTIIPSQSITACHSYYDTRTDSTYTTSTTIIDTLPSPFGCYNIITSNLTITNFVRDTQTVEACHSYNFNGQTLTASGTYTDTLAGAAVGGCDSIVTLHLTFANQLHSSIAVGNAPPVVTSLSSEFYVPYGVAVDGSGNIYVTDVGDNRVKKMRADGSHIDTLGSGFSDLGGGLAVDVLGNIYVIDAGYIKKMDASGGNIIIVGSQFSHPLGIAVDASGNIYVADRYNYAINKMSADGSHIDTLGLDLGLNNPNSLAVDALGNVYVVDNGHNALKKMDPSGANIITLYTGLNHPAGVALDASGNIYVADTYNDAIKKMDTSGANIQTLSTGLSFPFSVAVDASGNIYVTEPFDNGIKKIAPAPIVCSYEFGGQRLTESGTYIDTFTAVGGCDSIVTLHLTTRENTVYRTVSVPVDTVFAPGVHPFGIATDRNGNSYVTDTVTSTVRKISADGSVSLYASGLVKPMGITIDTLGNLYVTSFGLFGFVSKITTAGAVSVYATGLTFPFGITIDDSGNLYVGSWSGNTISKITPNGATGTVSPFASGVNSPQGIAIDNSENLYTTAGGSIVQKVTAGGGVSNFAFGLHTVRGIVADNGGNMYVTNQGDSSISKITSDGTVSTVASGFNFPFGISIDTSDNLYIANNGSNTVSKIVLPVPLCGSYTFGDSVYTASGTYSQTFVKSDGCDSVVTLNLTLSDSCVTGIKDVNGVVVHISVYPNPSSGVFTVASDIQQGGEIEVSTITGAKVYAQKVSSLSKNEINLSDKAKGIYIVQVTNVETVWIQRIIKE